MLSNLFCNYLQHTGRKLIVYTRMGCFYLCMDFKPWLYKCSKNYGVLKNLVVLRMQLKIVVNTTTDFLTLQGGLCTYQVISRGFSFPQLSNFL